MIETKNIHKNFSDLTVLNGVDLLVNKKEIVSIVGASGAGKTTLLQIIGTLEKPDTGSVLFNEKDVAKMGKKELADFRNKNIGFVFQFHNLLPEFSSLENICMPYLIHNNNYKEAEKKALQLMKALNILDKKESKPNELSGGEQQRVAIGRALINSPKLILADEPTGNLDSIQSEDMFKLFTEISKSFCTTFLIITHNNKLATMCDRIINIKDGQIIKS